MFYTGRTYPYDKFTAVDTSNKEYRIAPNDILHINMSTNKGEKLIEPNTTGNTISGNSYVIEYDGKIKLPIFGRIEFAGLTIREAEKKLETMFSTYYVEPFVALTVTNKRIFMFPGSITGAARVLPLVNENTNLLEALAQAGGIQGGKAKRIKLIRGDLKNPKVYLIDLSTIDGMKQANLVLQANDIIYIESRDRIPNRVIEAITPYLSVLSTLLIVYAFIK